MLAQTLRQTGQAGKALGFLKHGLKMARQPELIAQALMKLRG